MFKIDCEKGCQTPVLEQGHIIERGNHEDLLKQKGKYYQLYTGAFELD